MHYLIAADVAHHCADTSKLVSNQCLQLPPRALAKAHHFPKEWRGFLDMFVRWDMGGLCSIFTANKRLYRQMAWKQGVNSHACQLLNCACVCVNLFDERLL